MRDTGGRWHRSRRHGAFAMLMATSIGVLSGCSDLLNNSQLPAGTQDPSTYNTPTGAMLQVQGAMAQWQSLIPLAITDAGVVTDELVVTPTNWADLDSRNLPEGGSFGEYGSFQRVRGQAQLALGAVTKYAPDASPAIRGKMFAVQGYAEIYLADMYCSGVPLSDLGFETNFTYAASSTTAEVYQHALMLLDSAVVLSGDSATLQVLARVGMGRALVALGQYDSAAKVVAPVATSDAYQFKILFKTWFSEGLPFRVASGEGGNGLHYVGDPRVPVAHTTTTYSDGTSFQASYPTKYDNLLVDSVPFTVAGGIEARLIEAEAALHDNDPSWLTTLNTLRTDGTYSGIDTLTTIDTTFPGGVQTIDTTETPDTLWNAGTGGVAHLGPLSDPGTAAARVDTLFAERAMWLYMTGHRQGDVRRMIRQYGRRQDAVLPVGQYPNTTYPVYGSATNLPITPLEMRNPKFHGCLNRGA